MTPLRGAPLAPVFCSVLVCVWLLLPVAAAQRRGRTSRLARSSSASAPECRPISIA